MNKTKQTFKEDYFTDYYFPMTGNFSNEDLKRNMNWFYGWFDALKEWFNFQDGKGKKVLEIGCSIGGAARLLAERNFKVEATDISEFAIKHAKEVNKHKNLSFSLIDIEDLKTKEKFDLVFGFEVIEHLENLDDALLNMHKLLNKGGVCICSTPYPYSYVFIDETHINVRHPIDWKRRFEKAGFTNVKFKQVGFVPFFYRYSPKLHFKLPFGLPTPYINSPVFIYGEKI